MTVTRSMIPPGRRAAIAPSGSARENGEAEAGADQHQRVGQPLEYHLHRRPALPRLSPKSRRDEIAEEGDELFRQGPVETDEVLELGPLLGSGGKGSMTFAGSPNTRMATKTTRDTPMTTRSPGQTGEG